MLIKITDNQNIVTVSLSRPDVRNAFNNEMITQITEAFLDIGVRKNIRAVVLQGEGKAFCAGADLQMMKEMVNYSLEENKADAERLFSMFEAIADCPHPIISVVHGGAFGGALGLIACSDVVVCAESAQLCFSEVKLGLVPAVISHFVLKKASYGKVAPWMISGKMMAAKDAFDLGLVHEICSEGQLAAVTQKWLETFLEAGPEAVRETKDLISKVVTLDSKKARIETTSVIAERRVSKEGQEGLKSFLEKRKPNWRPS